MDDESARRHVRHGSGLVGSVGRVSRSADRQGATSYPQQWEADVVLRDGGTARIRPICPQDAEALRVFHARLSPETVYFRYFAPHPELSAEEISHLTNVDHHDRVALVVQRRGEIIGVGRYDRVDEESAEVAFVILDDAQGRGVGSLLLEHLAAAGREQGIQKFIAEVLPQNGRMLSTFRFAGYAVSQATDDGVVHVSFDIAESVHVDSVRESRAHRSEARSLEPLLRPRSIAVVGASRRPGSVGNTLLLNLITGGFTGQLFIVHPDADQILGIPCVRTLTEITSEIDLVAVCVPAEDAMTVVDDAAKAHANGLVIISGGFENSEAAARLGRFARSEGMRLLGPAAFGLINTEAAISVNCSLTQPMPTPGRTAFFCQSGALGADILRRMRKRELGVSSFISAGHRADVSGNDALQYWAEDSQTTSILMHLETLGNPRKFASLLSRVSQSKPVIVLRTTGAQAHDRAGECSTDDTDKAQALDQILADSGVIEVRTIDHMLDVAEILTHSGVLAGQRIGIVGNSEALEILAVNATEQEGLLCVSKPRTMARGSSADMYRRRLDEALRDDAVDIVLALHVPPVESTNDRAVAEVISECASGLAKPVVAVVLGVDDSLRGQVGQGRPAPRQLAIFSDVERALQAIGSVVRYSKARERLQNSATTEVIGDVDPVRARIEVDRLLTEGCNRISSSRAAEILGAYNIEINTTIECELPHALIAGVDDPRLGRLLSIDLADPVATLFTRTRYALSPISLDDALRLVRTSAVSVWLSSRVGSDATGFTTDAVEQAVVDMARLAHRVGELMHDVPQIVDVRLEIALSAGEGAKVTAATIQISKSGTDRPWATRSLTPVTG
jgi:acyl-CoA synthetase (NDP forming)/GNAT superfamily N-acetyltransferase